MPVYAAAHSRVLEAPMHLEQQHGDGSSVATRFDRVPNSVPSARRWVREIFCQAGADGDLIDVVLLLVSEVVTNAVVHGAGDELTVAVHPDLSVAVWDASSEMPQRRVADPAEVRGRGLELLDALAPGYRVYSDPLGGKVVHFAPKGW
ncbi:ATP-binding protein [Streptomyces litchfieldiae]|uniref:ATP-binding protein n=1 Tax=Streptomyces litchfieldiae TaxID=3075543 RepID=A0ABU2MPZ0_9ACTN|nr:ATP-binding protein [Streptomyces sp. DSM 44938]MDT0342699.1 ATP-binding protein [Streptomyces sp. DSM 44938]